MSRDIRAALEARQASAKQKYDAAEAAQRNADVLAGLVQSADSLKSRRDVAEGTWQATQGAIIAHQEVVSRARRELGAMELRGEQLQHASQQAREALDSVQTEVTLNDQAIEVLRFRQLCLYDVDQ